MGRSYGNPPGGVMCALRLEPNDFSSPSTRARINQRFLIAEQITIFCVNTAVFLIGFSSFFPFIT